MLHSHLGCSISTVWRFDLLTDVGVAEQSGDLSIVEDSRGNIQVEPTELRDPAVSGFPTAGQRGARCEASQRQ